MARARKYRVGTVVRTRPVRWNKTIGGQIGIVSGYPTPDRAGARGKNTPYYKVALWGDDFSKLGALRPPDEPENLFFMEHCEVELVMEPDDDVP